DTGAGPYQGQCVQCTPGKSQNCTQPSVCLPNDTCGCKSDSDCGDKTSGRVCGPAQSCIDGCRGTGGNGCPTSEVCTSKDDAIGQCVAGDGGASTTSGASGDGGLALDDTLIEGGGCGCHASERGSGAGVALLTLATAALATARRRRTR